MGSACLTHVQLQAFSEMSSGGGLVEYTPEVPELQLLCAVSGVIIASCSTVALVMQRCIACRVLVGARVRILPRAPVFLGKDSTPHALIPWGVWGVWDINAGPESMIQGQYTPCVDPHACSGDIAQLNGCIFFDGSITVALVMQRCIICRVLAGAQVPRLRFS